MQIKRIECPSCGVVLDVKNSSNETEKIISCPRCETKLKVKFKPVVASSEPIEARTFLGGQRKKPKPQQNGFETQLGGNGKYNKNASASFETNLSGSGSSFETQLGESPNKQAASSNQPNGWIIIKKCYLIYNFDKIELSVGRNIIGRSGKTPKATIPIPTDDQYMSRQHCCIDVTSYPDGSKKAILRNYLNKNITYINGTPLESSDIIILSDGDTIRMGDTIVTYKLL